MNKIKLADRVTRDGVASWACAYGLAYLAKKWGDEGAPATRSTVRRLIEGDGADVRYLFWFVDHVACQPGNEHLKLACTRYLRRIDVTYASLRPHCACPLRLLPGLIDLTWELAHYLHREQLAALIDAHFDLPE